MASGRPTDNNSDGWYEAAQRIDQARSANDAFCSTQRAATPAVRTAPGFVRLTPPTRSVASVSPLHGTHLPRPFAHAAPTPGNPVPMDVDASRMRSSLPETCFRCKKPGHRKAECPLRFDVRTMTQDEREDFIEHLLATKDMVSAPLPDPEEHEEAVDEEEDFQ